MATTRHNNNLLPDKIYINLGGNFYTRSLRGLKDKFTRNIPLQLSHTSMGGILKSLLIALFATSVMLIVGYFSTASVLFSLSKMTFILAMTNMFLRTIIETFDTSSLVKRSLCQLVLLLLAAVVLKSNALFAWTLSLTGLLLQIFHAKVKDYATKEELKAFVNSLPEENMRCRHHHPYGAIGAFFTQVSNLKVKEYKGYDVDNMLHLKKLCIIKRKGLSTLSLSDFVLMVSTGHLTPKEVSDFMAWFSKQPAYLKIFNQPKVMLHKDLYEQILHAEKKLSHTSMSQHTIDALAYDIANKPAMLATFANYLEITRVVELLRKIFGK